MTTILSSKMSDGELLVAAKRAAGDERRATAELLTLLAEVDTRRLYFGEGCASLFSYCTRVLHLSEHAAYHRIEAARSARQFPIVLQLLAIGDVTLTTVAMLRPHLTDENHKALLEEARHKTKREVEHQIACLAPKPDALTIVRRLPARETTLLQGAQLTDPAPGNAAAPLVSPARTVTTSGVPQSKVVALASDRYLLRVTLSADAHARLRRAQDLMRHTVPDGNAADIISHALTLLVRQLEKTKVANTARPPKRPTPAARSRNRHIPAHIRREVWARDGGRCVFVGAHGRCAETGRLEFHHEVPYARGGAADVANISLRCRAHNRFESENVFGPWVRQDSTHATRSGPS